MKGRQLLSVVGALLCAVVPVRAQASAGNLTANVPADSVIATVHAIQRSTIDRPSGAVHREGAALPAPLPSTGKQLGEAKTEMIVGGAAIVVGSLIGGDGGAVLVFGGAVVGLYGLWNYLK